MNEKIKIKICGITSPADCLAINDALPDFAGFVMTESKRQVTLNSAAAMAKIFHKSIKPIGVFRNESIATICDSVYKANLAGVQLHGDVDHARIAALRKYLPQSILIWQRLPVDLSLPAKTSFTFMQKTIDEMEGSSFQPDIWLLDSCRPGQIGGTGQNFNWTIFSDLRHFQPIAVAGGLTAENVSGAIRELDPYIVDCSSGVEIDGKKNKSKIIDFCTIIRQINGEM